MKTNRSNIVLIGMAGCGKSTIGRKLAAKMNLGFVDTDTLIEQSRHRTLQDIFDDIGPAGFRKLEEEVLLETELQDHVIATGGSSVYSEKGMAHLKMHGVTVWLDVELPVLAERVQNLNSRGLVKRPEQTFAELYAERLPLYRKYADIVFPCGNTRSEEICNAIVKLIFPIK